MKKTLSALVTAIISVVLLFTVANAAYYDDFKYTLSNNEITLNEYNGSDSELTVPSEIDGNSVIAIGSNFLVSGNITKVTIPNTVKTVGSYAFSECKSLCSIETGGNIEKIDNFSFNLCSSCKFISFSDKLVSVGDHAFSGDKNLMYLMLGDNVATIGEYAFYNCGTNTDSGTVIFCNENSTTAESVEKYNKENEKKNNYNDNIVLSYELGYSVDDYSKLVQELTAQETTAISATTTITTQTAKAVTTAATTQTTKTTSTKITETTKNNIKEENTTAADNNSEIDSEMLGDVNLDKEIDSKDAVCVLVYYANLLAGKEAELDCKFSTADVNSDDEIDAKDAVIILKYYAKRLVGFTGDIENM